MRRGDPTLAADGVFPSRRPRRLIAGEISGIMLSERPRGEAVAGRSRHMKIRKLFRRKPRPRPAEPRVSCDLRNDVREIQRKLLESARENLKPRVGG